jgi:hypothetical protein
LDHRQQQQRNTPFVLLLLLVKLSKRFYQTNNDTRRNQFRAGTQHITQLVTHLVARKMISSGGTDTFWHFQTLRGI